MATVAAAVYGSTSFSNSANDQNMHPPQSASGEQYISTFFCRALYDYQARDASSLSFHKNDIIEVLTQLDSGWWDGLLGDERGWFPSNYVSPISDEEVDSVLSGSDYFLQHPTAYHDSLADMSYAVTNQPERDLDWSGDMDPPVTRTAVPIGNAATSSDFWMPQVTSDAQIYYVNTQTGQQSREIPREADGTVADGDLAGLTSPPGTRVGMNDILGLGVGARSETRESQFTQAGFGVPKRSGTPEPWVRRLADNGRTYYYHNKLDGQVLTTLPGSSDGRGSGQSRSFGNIQPSIDPSTGVTVPTQLASTSTQTGSRPRWRQNVSDHHSLHSEDSDIDHSERDPPASFSDSQSSLLEQTGRKLAANLRQPTNGKAPTIQLTPAERLAQSIQQTMAPAPPELVTELSDTARRAIAAVVSRVQSVGLPRGAETDQEMEDLINAVVVAVRDLVYVSAPPSGHIPSTLIPPHARDPGARTASQARLKPAQRKVTTTLSKLVLSARTIQYDSGSSTSDAPLRIEEDAEELERAVVAFVLEVQRSQNQSLVEQLGTITGKRLRGVLLPTHIGLGLVGAGAAGNWKGFGWVALDDSEEGPGRILGTEVIKELGAHLVRVQENLNSVLSGSDHDAVLLTCTDGQNALTHLSAFLAYVADIHVARHVDVDGINMEAGSGNEVYMQSVEKARLYVRTLEAAVQALYDDGSTLLMTIQAIRHVELGQPDEGCANYGHISTTSASLRANLQVVYQSLEVLLSVGHHQADMSHGDYAGSIEWRMSRMSMDNAPRSSFESVDEQYDPDGDVVDMATAFANSHERLLQPSSWEGSINSSEASRRRDSASSAAPTWGTRDSVTPTILSASAPEVDASDDSRDSSSPLPEDENSPGASAKRGIKLAQVFGEQPPTHYLNAVNAVPADTKPWYLKPNYDPSEILIDPDGGVKGGTVAALVERLTPHEQMDPTFIKTFLMTFKSFTAVDELFELLVARFNIQPPPNLTPGEHQDWVKLKQHVIQARVMNTFKSMIVDEDVLEKEDMYILDRMRDFISRDEVSSLPAAKQLMILIERSRGGDAKILINTNQERPPPPILPRNSKKPKLLDIDPLELARQLTILESNLYQKIRPMECLVRSRKQSGEHNDNIATIIQLCNRIALWVTDCILEKEDSRKRAAVLKQFISVAERCRLLHNYSSMVAIISGLNNPPIRRLKRTWEQVNSKFMALLNACEMTIDTGKNFGNYRATLAKVAPPCVPFIGVFLTTLTFIQDGAEDNISGNMINFRKRQKASEVIREIKRWQSPPFNFQPVPSIQAYLEEALRQFTDSVELGDYFWNLSLEREPREREDEKMARLLQESGFL